MLTNITMGKRNNAKYQKTKLANLEKGLIAKEISADNPI